MKDISMLQFLKQLFFSSLGTYWKIRKSSATINTSLLISKFKLQVLPKVAQNYALLGKCF